MKTDEKQKNQKITEQKTEKSTVKLVPLLIVIVLFLSVITALVLFRNTIAKTVIVQSVQAMSGAKCDVESVHIGFSPASISITGFEAAHKENPMKNIFSFEKAVFSYNFTEIFKGRFIVNESSIINMTSGSQRKKSGALGVKNKKNKEKSKEKKALPFENQVTSLYSQALERASVGVDQVFDSYNPNTIMNKYLTSLKTPAIAEAAQKQAMELSAYWTAHADELQKSAHEVYDASNTALENVKKVTNSSIVDINAINAAISSTNTTINQTQKAIALADTSVKKLQNDALTIAKLSQTVQNAVNQDKNFVNAEIAKITSFTVKDGMRLITGSLDTIALNILGTNYPAVKNALEQIEKFEKSNKKPANKNGVRFTGRTVDFNNKIPSLHIKKMELSGSDSNSLLLIGGIIHNITNNADLINAPTVAKLTLKKGDFDANLDAVIDLRSNRTGAPITVDLKGSGIPVNLSAPVPKTVSGIPSISGSSTVTAHSLINFNGDFSLTAGFLVKPAIISVKPFTPEFIYGIYSKSLTSISDMSVTLNADFSTTSGVTLGISSDIDKKFAGAVTSQVNAEINALKKNLVLEAANVLNGYTAQYESQITQFNAAKNNINAEKAKLDKIQTELQAEKTKAENKIKNQAVEAVKKQAENLLPSLPKKLF